MLDNLYFCCIDQGHDKDILFCPCIDYGLTAGPDCIVRYHTAAQGRRILQYIYLRLLVENIEIGISTYLCAFITAH